MDPISIALIGAPFVYQEIIVPFTCGIGVDIGKAKVLPLLESKETPVINHHLARALMRTVSISLENCLNEWEKTPEGDMNKRFVHISRKQLRVLFEESRNNKDEWKGFLEQCNGKALSDALEGLRCQEPADATQLAGASLLLLQKLLPEGQKVPDGFKSYLRDAHCSYFKNRVYEFFREEIKKDPKTFNAFSIDFMSKIYEGVERAYPNADILAEAMTKQLNRVESKIDTLPEDVVEALKQSGIVLTVERHREILKEEQEELIGRLLLLQEREKNEFQDRLIEVQRALSDNRELNKSYGEKIKRLEEQINSLQSRKGEIPQELLNSAVTALRAGDTEKALSVFKRMDDLSDPHIAAAAESKFQQGIIAEEKNQVLLADNLFIRATQLSPKNVNYLFEAGRYFLWRRGLDKAINYFEQALDVLQAIHHSDHLDMARPLNMLGIASSIKNDKTRVMPYLKQALAIRQKYLPKDHPDIAESYYLMGDFLEMDEGDFDAAIECYEKAIAISQSEKPPNCTKILKALACALESKGRQSKGNSDAELLCHEKALAIRQETLPADHSDIAVSFNNLGTIWELKNNYDIAISYYSQALTIREKIYPNGYPDLVESKRNLKRAKKLKHNHPMPRHHQNPSPLGVGDSPML